MEQPQSEILDRFTLPKLAAVVATITNDYDDFPISTRDSSIRPERAALERSKPRIGRPPISPLKMVGEISGECMNATRRNGADSVAECCKTSVFLM